MQQRLCPSNYFCADSFSAFAGSAYWPTKSLLGTLVQSSVQFLILPFQWHETQRAQPAFQHLFLNHSLIGAEERLLVRTRDLSSVGLWPLEEHKPRSTEVVWPSASFCECQLGMISPILILFLLQIKSRKTALTTQNGMKFWGSYPSPWGYPLSYFSDLDTLTPACPHRQVPLLSISPGSSVYFGSSYICFLSLKMNNN